MLPNFFIGGVSSGGTSFLARAIAQHPEIYMPENIVPEPHFFLKSWEYEKGLEYYQQRWFSKVGDVKAIGEKSSSYLFGGKTVAKRIKANIKNARFIFSLRNPIERTWASYRFTALNGLESLDFEKALKYEKQRVNEQEKQWSEIQPYNYTGRGLYAAQLKSFMEIFSREDIHILKFENMSEDPSECLRNIFEFLDVDPNFQPKINSKTFSSVEVKDPILQKKLRDKFGDRFSHIVKAVREGASLAEVINGHEESKYIEQFKKNLHLGKSEIKPETRGYLQKIFHDDMLQLQDLIDFSIDDWV